MSGIPRLGLVLGLLAVHFCAFSSFIDRCLAQSPSVPAAAPAIATGATQAPVTAATSTVSANPLVTAHALFRKGDFEGAIAQYQVYANDHPQLPDGYTGMVRAYLKEKKVGDAARTADEGLAHSNSAPMRTAHAEVLFRQGKIVEAEKEWVDVINSGYPEARAYLGLARVRHTVAMYKSERSLIQQAHSIDPSDAEIQEAWVVTLSFPERVKYLETALAGENNWSPEEREDAANYLQFLKERSKQKASPCRLVGKGTGTETSLVPLLGDAQHLRGYGLAVSLNGHKSSLLLDTGSSNILVKRSIAERAGISKISETKVFGIGKKGRRNAYIGIVDSIKVGDLEFQNCPIEVMEGRSVGGEDGLIGADVFEDFLVELDFPNTKLRLSELPRRPGEAEQKLELKSEGGDSDDETTEENSAAQNNAAGSGNAKAAEPKPAAQAYSGPQDRYLAPEMQSYTKVLRFGHQLLVPTTIGNVPYKLFLLDTGSLTNFISPAAAREVTKVHGDSDIIVEGISGRVDKVFSANKATLIFGRLRQENQDMVAFDITPISDDTGTEISGFLGFTTLRFLDIKIDYRDALVDFHYDAKRWH